MKWSYLLSAWILGLSSFLPVSSAAQQLITESEHKIYGGLLEPMSVTVSDPGSPEILIVKPEIERVLSSPISIQLMVIPSDGAAVNWDSFRLNYGSLRFDITDRFLRLAKKTQTGFSVDGLEIPQGDHRLQMSVRDTRNRWGAREFVLHVGKERVR